jgi:hypothetical protein
MGFYTHKKISDSTTCIIDGTGVHCFLVEGKNKAMITIVKDILENVIAVCEGKMGNIVYRNK